MTDDAFKAESGKTNVSQSLQSRANSEISSSRAWRMKSQALKLPQKKGKQTVSLKLAKKEEKTWHKLLDDASTKEAVADDTANSNTKITSCVNQATQSDSSKNLEEPSPTENEAEIDDQTRSMDSHEIQCEKKYWSDPRVDTGTLFHSWQDRQWNNTV